MSTDFLARLPSPLIVADRDPKSVVIRALLEEIIRDGAPAGTALPSERVLAAHLGVARMTVRHALDELVEANLIERNVGIGTLVAHPKLDLQVQLTSYSEEMQRRGMVPDAKVLSFGEIPASQFIAQELHVPEGHPVVRFKRQLLADSEPMSVDENYIRADLVPGFATGEPPKKLYQELSERFGLIMEWGEDAIEATSADKTNAALLKVDIGAPLLKIQRHAYVKRRMVDFSVSYYRADRYKIWVPLQRPGRGRSAH